MIWTILHEEVRRPSSFTLYPSKSSEQHWKIHLDRISLHGTDLFLEKSQSLKTPTYVASSNTFRWIFDPLGNLQRIVFILPFTKNFYVVYDQVTVGSSCYRVLKKGTYEDCTKIQGILAEPSQSEPFFPDEVFSKIFLLRLVCKNILR